MDGQAPPPVAVAPESPPQPSLRLETEAEDNPVVAPDAVSSEASKVGAHGVVPQFPSSSLKMEDDPVVVLDSVKPASSEASEVGAGGVVLLQPPSSSLVAEEDPLIVPETPEAASLEATNAGTGDGVPLPLPSPPLEVGGDPLVVPGTDGSTEGSDEVTPGGVLTDELRDKIVKQVEYYFSDENLPTDDFMLKFVMKNKEGLGNVPLGVIASFRKMKKLVQDHSTIEAALRTSSKLVVSSNGKRVRRLHPLPCNELEDVKKRTVVVENLPLDFSLESIQEKFGTVGKIMKITIHDPHAVGKLAASKKPDFMLSNKVHAIVEYQAVEAAEKAVATLNDERNWRTGLRVVLLAKRSVVGSGKHIQSSKENHGTVMKKNNEGQFPKELQQSVSEKNGVADSGEVASDKENVNSEVNHEEVRQHQRANASGGRKGRYSNQGKGLSGQDSVNKPISGPRMPDGTRGFTMGRGRSIPLPKAEKAEKAEE